MLTCNGCNKTFPTVIKLTSHMTRNCIAMKNVNSFLCGQQGCCRRFTYIKSLRKHIREMHLKQKHPMTTNHVPHQNISDEPGPSQVVNEIPGNELQIKLALLLSSLYSILSVPRNTVQLFVSELLNFVVSTKDVIINRFTEMSNALGNNITPEIFNILETILQEYSGSLTNLSTEFRRFQFFQNIGSLILPYETIIGYRMDTIRTGNNLNSGKYHDQCKYFLCQSFFQNIFQSEM
jgi:hypothetical protein